ncbi:MAG TPA: strawberry notch C-terminal domain-containing protein, partial [Deltaproteobacteria bacterium]|nr:strawberry notch C-terminal domain-containing protein [Deltaproteobacteria bacterium]
MADARYLGSMNPDELRKLGKQRAIEELAKRSTNRSEKPSGEDPSKGQYLGSMPPDELILRMELMRDKAKKDYLRENYESRNVLEDTAAALTAGTLQLAEMSARAARLGREPEDTPNLTKFIEGIDKFREDKQFLKPSREALTREGRRWLYEGVSSAIPSVGLGLPGAAVGSFGGPIGTVGGFAGSAGTVFGMAEFDEFWENARKGAKEGKIDPAMMSEINKKALMSAFAEGGMEAVNKAIDMLAFKVGKVVTAPLKESVRGMLTKGVKGVAKDMAKGYAVALPNEVATEMMQNYLTTKMRKDLGINEVEPIEAAKQSAGPAAVMTLLFGVGAAKFNYEQRLSALKALQDPDTKTKARMAAARAIADELKVYDDKHGTTYAKQWVGDSFSSIMRKKPVDIDSKIIKKYSQEPRKGEEPPEAEPPVQEAPPETPPPPPGSGEITGGPGTTPPPMGEDEPILPEDELDAEDAAKEHDEDDLDKIIETDDAADETDTEPTDAEIEAGNYKKGHVKLHGMDISIENPRGSTRKGVDEDGKEWETTFTHHYGYIKGTVGRDKDHIDTFIGPNPASDRAFVVNQVNPKTGKFDEHKIMLGFDSIEEAQQGYLSNYEAGWTGLGSIHELDVEDLRTWTKDGDTKIEYDPQDYPEFHEETIDDEETVTGGAPGTPAPGGEIGITGGPRPQGETGGIGLPEDILKGLEEIFGEKPPAGEVQGGERVPEGEKPGEPAKDQNIAIKDLLVRNGWNTNEEYGYIKDGGEDRVWILSKVPEAWSEETVPPKSMDDPVIVQLEEYSGKVLETKRYDTFREFIDAELVKYGDMFEDQGEIEAKGQKEKPGEITGGERAPKGEKPEGETKPAEGETTAPSGETKPEKPKKEESKQDKAVKAFDELADESVNKTEKDAFAIIDQEDSGQYGRLVESVMHILRDMAKSVKSMKGHPDQVKKNVENALELLSESDSWIGLISESSRSLGANMATQFNSLTVYNKAQWLAREIGDAVGEGRFQDALKYLNEIKTKLGKGNADYSKWVMSFKMNDDGTLKPYTSLQEKGKLKWGKKIGGSRADIAGMSGTQKKAEVNKEFVWPSPDYVSMVKQGTEPHVAYLIKRIRDSIPASPKGDLSDSDFDIYVESLEQIRDSFDNVRTEDEMKDACSGLLALAKVARRAEGNQASVFRNRKWMNTSELLYRGSIKKFEKEIKYVDENGWPGGGAWRRGIRIVETTARNENDDIVEVWAIERRLGQGRFEYWGQVATGFETREAAEKYLEETLRPQIEQELKNRKLTRPRLKKVIRKGPDYRGGKDIEPEKFLKTFGFRKGWGEEGAGMETGKWNKSTLQMYINCAYDSFMDLARALNVDPKVMSLNGRISIAFGARGHGGLAMAHYESTRMVINLTKMNGAGSLAHEWGHALDHYMRSLFSETPGMAGHYLSDFTFKTSFYDAGHLNGNDELREAMYLLWNDRMHSRYSTPSEILALAENVISKNKSTLSVLIENLSKKVKDEGKIERFTKMTEEIIDADPADAAKKIDALGTLYQELSGSTLETKYIVGLKDNYKYIAVKLREAEDAKNGASVGSKRLTDWVRGFDRIPSKARREYYSSPIEMWARAFESFIEDTIAGYGLSSNYLVHGTFNDKYSYPIYPSDEERDSINTGISDVIKLLGFPEFKEESKPIITTEWDNPQFEEDEEETEGPEETETETPTAEITIEDYTEKSIVVRDHTPDGKHKKRIAELGGEYNPNLKRGAPGFIFPKWKRERVEEAFADILYGGEHGKPIYPYQDLQLEDLKSNEKVGILAKNMLALLKSGWHVGKNATAIRAEVARMLNTKPDKITDWGQGYTKDIDELIEYALVMRSREIIDSAEVAGENIKETYDRLKDLYENQPRLGSRTSDSAENQAYSTPLHIAWIMQKASEIGEKTSVYEPTAGTGMLLTMASPENVTANEIDKRRRAILKDQGMAEVTDIDGRKAVSLSGTLKAFDVVLANPPFGKTDSKSIDGFLMSKLEHQIAVDALKAMKDRGRAAIIIGGHNFKDGKMSVTDKIFFNWLYSKYNVTANIEMPGSVYAKQGTTFPFRILFINGVNKTGKGIAPEKDDIISLGSTDDLFDLLQKGELYGARRISPEGTEDVEEGMGPVGGSGGARGGGKGFGSSDVLPGPGGETGDDGGKKPKPGGRASGSTGGPSGGIMAPGTEGSGGGTGTDDGRTGGTGDGSADVPAGAGGPGSPGVGEGQGGSQRGRTGRPGEESGLEDIPGISPVEKQIASMSDEDIDSLVDGLVEKNTEKSAGDLAKEAGKELAAGLHDAVKGLTTLFTPKDTLSMGLVFDEETYRKALPLFQSSLEHIKASGIIGKEAVEKLASDLLNKFGNSIAPFVKRFMKEVRTETKNLHQVPYEALSKRPPVEDTFIPKNMARPLRQALERIQNQVGDIDAYITSKLEYPDVKTMWEHFSPDQIDAIAIGIYNMSRGQTLIVGDQTGVGKGRVGAAMIRYAHLQGKRAVFFTEKPNLFTDNYRDIVDIGWGDKFKPFIVASNEELADIRDQEGTKVFELLPSDKRRAAMAKFAGTDDPKEIKKYGLSGTPADEDGLTRDENVLADYNTILVTYSQVNVENLQRRFLSRVARGSMLILDESHNAAGSGSNTGEYMQGLIQGLGPNGDLMFLSATFAKRPDTMGLYIQRTAQEAANMKPKEIVDAIIAGKTPMQEWVCASLTKTGQHVRREKSFRGIEMRTYYDSKNRELHEGIADGVMENAREIMDVDRKITKAFNAAVARAIKAGSKDPDAVIDIFGVPWKPGWVKGDDGKARMSNTVSKSNFAATVHNLVRQTLFSLKCDLAVEQAIKELEGKDNPLHDKDGYLIRGPRRQKPVIAVSGTLESFLMEASKSGELVSGNSYEMKLKDVIRIYHRRNLRVLIKDRKGNEQRYTMNPDLFPEDLKEEFYRVERDILEKTPDLPGSPIDYMIYKLRKAGVRVGEITGRKFMLEHDLDTGRPVFKPRKDKRAEAIIGFNNGPSRNEDIPELDCLIVNSAGSAGLSIHAGPKTDKVPRIYLGVQAELDIDKEVQKMGRINRKGQVVLPEFRHLALDIPAEVRPATVLSRKMRSMSANTSANADSPLANKDFPDMINHHGDEITYEWMTDHTEVMVSMGTDDLTYLNVSGKIAIQPVAVQREFFDEVEETYNLRMENLKKRGEWDLDVETYDYRADTVSKDITVEGSNEDNPFGGSTYMEEVTTENRSKPMWWDEITKEIEKELGGKTPEEYNEAFLEKMRERMEEYRKKVLARWEEAKEKRRQAAEKKKAEAPKEGEDYITDDIDTGKTDKGQDDKEEKEPAILAKMKKQYDDLEHLLTGGSLFSPNFEVGTTLRITRGFSVGATVLKIRARGKEGNPVEPGKIEVTLAFTGMEREIEIPLSKLRRMHDEGKEDDYIMAHEDIGGERWDSMRSALVRETRHIVTGNLLQGFIGFQGSRRAQLIRYTTIDGNVKDGIIMPRGFESPTDSSTSLVRISQNKAYAFMQASGLNRSDQYLDDEAVRVTPSEIRVAGSRQLGGKYFLDPELKSLVKQNNFEKSGKYYIAQYNQANQKEIIDVLTKLGCRFSVLRGAYNIAFGGLEEQDDLAEFALGGKKVAQNQLLVSAINNAIAPITEKWGGGPRIYVLENIGKLPDGLREQAYRANSSSPGSVRGIYHRGSVYLIAENLSGAAEAQEVLLHEIIGHHGLRRAFGRRLDSLLDEVFSLMSKKDKDLVNKYYGFNLSRKSGQRRLAEEYIAKQAEKGALTPTIWQKIIAAIRKWLAEMGFSIKASDEKLQEIVTHALSMSRMYMNSEEATEGPDAYSIAEDKPEIDTKSLFPEEIIAALAPILKRWKNHPDITVVDSISELPAGLRRQAIMAGAITGAFYNDTVYLVADGIGSIDEAYKTILHEIVGHWGLRKTLGPGFDSFLSRLYADIDKARLQPIAEQYGLDLSKRSDQLVCMEEYLASLAERDERPAAWRRLVAWVRTWLMNMGFKLKTSQSDVDMLIASALGKARKYVQGGTAYAVEGFEGGQPVLRVAAFHGSPHTFDKFSTEKIGTGEGAQAYGYGLYFAGKKEVAEFYKKELAQGSITFDSGETITPDWDDPGYNAIRLLRDAGNDYDKAISSARELTPSDWGLSVAGKLREYRKKGGKVVGAGHLYEVELAPEEDEYLLWDKPLSEQGEKVKKAISD